MVIRCFGPGLEFGFRVKVLEFRALAFCSGLGSRVGFPVFSFEFRDQITFVDTVARVVYSMHLLLGAQCLSHPA